MNTTKKILIACAVMMVSSLLQAQYLLDYGVSVGASNYLGEIGGKEKTRRDFILDLKLSQTRSAIASFVRYKLNRKLYVRGSFGWYRISGADKYSTNPGRVGRNLNFRNDILEISATGQYVFYDVADLGRTYRYRNDFKAYIFTGVASFMHNPKANYQGSWVALKPLTTEGQGLYPGAPKPYGTFQLSIPAGGGFFFTFSKIYRIGWEINWRTTFTDYLDDVSSFYADPNLLSDMGKILANRNPELVYSDNPELPHPNNYIAGNKRGDPKHKDSYLSTTLNFSYVIKGKSKFARARYSSFFGKKAKGRTIRAKF